MSLVFNYENQEAWGDLPGSASRGSSQSPIDILTKDIQSSGTLPQLKFTEWTVPVSGTLQNKGHTIQFTQHAIDSHPRMFHNHKGAYVLRQFHFHWGECEARGSEHHIDGKQYEAELHIVHTKEGSTSKTSSDACSVIAVFCQVDNATADVKEPDCNQDSPPGKKQKLEDQNPEQKLDDIVWKLLDIPEQMGKGESIDVTQIRYSDLLPKNLDYYYYEGSLTTPPCSEVVQWFVLKEAIKIPASFLSKLRQIQTGEEGKVCSSNFRDVQPLNGRQVLTSSKE